VDILSASLDYLIVAVIGGSVGAVEIVQRLRDSPLEALRTRPAYLYILVNAGAALLALALLRLYGWELGVSGDERARWTQVIAAGLSAIALLRTTITSVRANGEVIPSGPGQYLLTILHAADDALGRQRAVARGNPVAEATKGVLFSKASSQLPPVCFGMLGQVAREEDRQRIVLAVRDIEALTGTSDATKGFLLGLELVRVVGLDVLKAAIVQLGPDIT